MIRIGVLGAGHLGKIHIRLLKELVDQFDLVGFYDPNDDNANFAASEFGLHRFETIAELLEEVDAVDIVTPTITHFTCAKEALEAGKHVFIEKPLTETLEEGRKLMEIAQEKKRIVQVGHVERFNPAFLAAQPYFGEPMFIETHRLAQFNPRGCDVPVVLDLMIHDIANARLEFENGCVANLTTSRISLKNMRKSRFFQKNAYISVDFLSKEMEVITMEDVQGEPDPFDMIMDLGAGKPSKKIMFDKPEIVANNAIKEELSSFGKAISNKTIPIVSIEDGFAALQVAHRILEKLS